MLDLWIRFWHHHVVMACAFFDATRENTRLSSRIQSWVTAWRIWTKEKICAATNHPLATVEDLYILLCSCISCGVKLPKKSSDFVGGTFRTSSKLRAPNLNCVSCQNSHVNNWWPPGATWLGLCTKRTMKSDWQFTPWLLPLKFVMHIGCSLMFKMWDFGRPVCKQYCSLAVIRMVWQGAGSIAKVSQSLCMYVYIQTQIYDSHKLKEIRCIANTSGDSLFSLAELGRSGWSPTLLHRISGNIVKPVLGQHIRHRPWHRNIQRQVQIISRNCQLAFSVLDCL